MKTRVQLSAEELETWLVLHQNELKAAALDEPLISALFATGDRAAFVASFLSRNGINAAWIFLEHLLTPLVHVAD
jgi:hypothetical protein